MTKLLSSDLPVGGAFRRFPRKGKRVTKYTQAIRPTSFYCQTCMGWHQCGSKVKRECVG